MGVCLHLSLGPRFSLKHRPLPALSVAFLLFSKHTYCGNSPQNHKPVATYGLRLQVAFDCCSISDSYPECQVLERTSFKERDNYPPRCFGAGMYVIERWFLMNRQHLKARD